jgi:hypothetical protein
MPWRSGHFLVSAAQPQLSGSSKTRRSYRTSGLRARASETRFPISGPRDGSSDYSLIDAKGGWILQMVRGQLGDAKFWKAVQHYTRKFTFQNATTSDFVEAISESTGQDLEWLFDQYVYRPGHPSFDVAWEYDAAEHTVHVAVKQIEGGSTERITCRSNSRYWATASRGPFARGLTTLSKIEKCDAGVSLGPYATVLFIMGMADRLADVADPKHDAVGLELEEEHLPEGIRLSRGPKSKKSEGTGAK